MEQLWLLLLINVITYWTLVYLIDIAIVVVLALYHTLYQKPPLVTYFFIMSRLFLVLNVSVVVVNYTEKKSEKQLFKFYNSFQRNTKQHTKLNAKFWSIKAKIEFSCKTCFLPKHAPISFIYNFEK